MFYVRDARTILSTRIPQYDTNDSIAWVNSNNDHYSVKSGTRHGMRRVIRR